MILITFEGIDGSGKTTQINLLKKRLETDGNEVVVFREPGGTELSEMIRGILLNPEIEINPVTELLLFSAARSQLVAQLLRSHGADKTVVILDRFYDSTVAYQGFGRKSVSLEQIYQLNKIASHGLVPHLTFYLRIDLESAETRRSTFSKDRMERAGSEFFKEVIRGFDVLAEKETRFITIDALQSIDSIHDEIFSKVKELL